MTTFFSCANNEKINGAYEIIGAYAHLFHRVPYDSNGKIFKCNKIETKKLGEKITISNKKLIFDNVNYKIIKGNTYSREGVLDYNDFIYSFVGMNYGLFDINIIGENYTGKVKAMTMKSNMEEYNIFFADNKLIIIIMAYRHKTEFEYLIVSKDYDYFFYIAEKIRGK